MNEGFRQPTSDQIWRVKVYLLNDHGNWDDYGTGVLELVKEVQSDEEKEFLKITTTDDSLRNNSSQLDPEKLNKLKGECTSPNVLLYLPILQSNQYEKQSGQIFLFEILI